MLPTRNPLYIKRQIQGWLKINNINTNSKEAGISSLISKLISEEKNITRDGKVILYDKGIKSSKVT